MHPSKGDYSGRRTAPLSVTPAVAMNESEVGRDLLMRLRVNTEGENANEQAIATREFSQGDIMRMNFFLDITSLSISKAYSYENRLMLVLCIISMQQKQKESAELCFILMQPA